MRTSCVKIGLVMVVILLFFGVALFPVITAVDNDTDDVDDESIDNFNENGKSDSYKEIITLIYGNGRFNWLFRRGLFRGSAVIRTFGYDELYLQGFRLSKEGNIEYYSGFCEYIDIYFYRGFDRPIPSLSIGPITVGIFGIALGNINIYW